MDDSPVVSIIIPCYNSELWIEDTLESVFNQTCQSFEIIVVDDGSTDNTKQVLKPYIKKEKIRYYYQTNKGPAKARNLGIKKAVGKYIAFLDSDDMWKANKLEKQVNFLENNPDCKLVFSSVTVIDETGKVLYDNINQVPENEKELIRDFFLGKITMCTPTIVAERKSVLEVGGFDGDLPHREDHFFLMNMASKFNIKYFSECLVERRIRENSMSQKELSNLDNPERKFKLYGPFIRKAVEKYSFLEEFKDQVLAKINLSVGIKYLRGEQRIKSIKFIMKSISHNPFRVKSYILLILNLIPIEYSKLKHKCKELFGLN